MTQLDMAGAIRKLRERRGWSQGHLSKEIYASRQYVWKIENRVREPGMDVIVRLADAFGIRPCALVAVAEKVAAEAITCP